MNLLIVIVSYRVTELTLDCLHSLVPQVESLQGVRIAVCENGTSAADARTLLDTIQREGWESKVSLISLDVNLGFTGGNNAILDAELASPNPPDCFLLLNADTIVRPGAIEALIEFMVTHAEVGIAGSRLEDPEGTPQHSAFRFHHFLCEFCRGLRLGIVTRLFDRWQTVLPMPDTACQVDWVSGASLMVRREVLMEVGTLDEGFYTYFDDIDICRRADRAGWPTWYVPSSRVVHLEGKTTGVDEGRHGSRREKRRPRYWFDARRRYFLKHDGPIRAALADAGFIIGSLLWKIRRWIQRKPDADPEHFLRDFLRYSVYCRGFRIPDVKNPLL